MEKPFVSICIPTYNGEKFLKETLESINAQTYNSIEVIISDDNSTDETLAVIKKVTEHWNLPVFIYSHSPSGIGANWNNCIKHANGKYIKFVFQDDLINPECIEEMVGVAEKDTEIGLVFCKRQVIGEIATNQNWLQMYGDLTKYWVNLNEIQDGTVLLKQSGFVNKPYNKIGEPSVVLLKKDIFNEIGYFSEQLKQSLDYEFWYRTMAKYKVGFVDRTLASFRMHSAQASFVNKNPKNYAENYYYHRSIRNLAKYMSFKSFFIVHYRYLKYYFYHVLNLKK